jgi:tetratricopeptide (TPR) repeat protein
MSKQSGRFKPQRTPPSSAALVEQGRQAFQQGHYDRAIQAWEQVRVKPNTPDNLPTALAEAYFRRALTKPTPSMADLRQASQLQPADPRYRYHLALAQHRVGLLSEAETIYRQLLAESPPFKRAAEPLAHLLVERKKVVSKDPVWAYLSPETQTYLTAAEAIIKQKAVSTLARLADDSSLTPLWQALLKLASGDWGKAEQSLQTVLTDSAKVPPLARAVAHYYLGVVAARHKQLDQALAQWRSAQADSLNTRHLRQNLAALLYQQALVEQQAGRPAQALELFEQFGNLRGTRLTQTELYRQLNLEVGYTASQQGDWQQALSHWQMAEQAGDDSRKLLMNLALAYQHVGQYFEAAECWRELLRRRPRKANHPEALNEEQVARLWQNVAENYSKAGDYEEAIKTYRNGIKWASDNINLRLKLVEALQTDGRWQAAINELERILGQHPDHVQTMIMLAEMYSEDFWTFRRARQLWQRVLELEPQNPIARQQLAYLYEKEGNFSAQWGHLREALKVYQEGLKLVPDSQRLCVVIGGTYADLKDYKQTRHYFEKALTLNPNDLQTLYTIFLVWLEHDSERDLKQTVERVKALTGAVPGSFFVDLIDRCLEHNQHKQAKALLEYAEGRYADTENTLVDLAIRYAQVNQENRAVAILRQILQDNPDHPQANLRLGSIYYRMGQTRLAHRHWDRAETQARKENNQMILYELKMNKDLLIHGKQPPRTPLEMLQNMPPELRQQMLNQLPPEIAAILQNLSPDMIETMLGFEAMDDFFDEDDEDEEEDDYVW